jgi:hypothetical protein
MPPVVAGSVAQRLLGDQPSFDRSATIPQLHADVAEFPVQLLRPAR